MQTPYGLSLPLKVDLIPGRRSFLPTRFSAELAVACDRRCPHCTSSGVSSASMQSFDELLREAEIAHGHLCAGQILGVRMAMLGCARLGIDDPKGADRKRLVTFVEIDRCATDAIAVVTGCRLGKRALKFRDWGKMAATFVDLKPLVVSPSPGSAPDLIANRAIRISARESSKQRARELYPDVEPKNQQQMLAYRELPDSDLFSEQWVTVPLHAREMPGYKSGRIVCTRCGEGINYDRQVVAGGGRTEGEVLCQGCAHPEARYYQPLGQPLGE